MYLAREPSTGPEPKGWLDEFNLVYAFIFSRVGNRADAEDLTQEVAFRAWPRLRGDASKGEVRGYLLATARSALANFWAERLRIQTAPLVEDFAGASEPDAPEPSAATAIQLAGVLDALPHQYRTVLELRFLRAYSLREVASALGKSVGAIKVMQLRALRAAARLAQSRGDLGLESAAVAVRSTVSERVRHPKGVGRVRAGEALIGPMTPGPSAYGGAK